MKGTPTAVNVVIEYLEIHIAKNGPTRVVVDESGRAVSPKRALKDFNVDWRVAFIREDGWSLGAPRRLESVAYDSWSDHWLYFMRRFHPTARRIADYNPKSTK